MKNRAFGSILSSIFLRKNRKQILFLSEAFSLCWRSINIESIPFKFRALKSFHFSHAIGYQKILNQDVDLKRKGAIKSEV